VIIYTFIGYILLSVYLLEKSLTTWLSFYSLEDEAAIFECCSF